MVRYLVLTAIALLSMATFAIAQEQPLLTSEEQVGQGILDWFTAQNMGWIATVAIGVKLAAELFAKLIPDSATGFMGILRKILKIASVYIPNKK